MAELGLLKKAKNQTETFKWTPSWIAWALGSFGFLIAAVFGIRIYQTHWFRNDVQIVREDMLRTGEHIQAQIEKMMNEAEGWRQKMPLDPGYHRWSYGPPVDGVLAYRVYETGKVRAEWSVEGFKEATSGLVPILARESETRFGTLNEEQMVLAWVSQDGRRSVLIFNPDRMKTIFFNDPYRANDTSLVLFNSMNQMIFETKNPVGYEDLRGKLQYRYEASSELQIQELGTDILGFWSIPSVKGLVLIGRVRRSL